MRVCVCERERESVRVCVCERERCRACAEQAKQGTVLRTIDFETCESIRFVRRQNRDSYMNRFLCAPLVFSEAAQHGLAPFVACSWGWGLSGFVT